MATAPQFAFVPLASPLCGEAQLQGLIATYGSAFEALGGRRIDASGADGALPSIFFIVSGGTERQALDLHAKLQADTGAAPVWLLAHPTHNSLPAAMEVLARSQQLGQRGRIFYLRGPDDREVLAALQAGIADLQVYWRLRQDRIGLVGEPSDWLVASMPDHDAVRRAWGADLVPIPVSALHEAMERVDAETLGPIAQSLCQGAEDVLEPGPTDISAAVRVYLGLRAVVEQHRLTAVTVRCFDLVVARQTTGCFALSELNDEGLVAGCEGDLASAVGMLWVRQLLGQSSWMANPAQLEPDENALWLAHCTVPRRLVAAYRLRSHFESGLGVGIQGAFAAGPVTLLRVGGPELRRVWIAEGDILRRGSSDDLCRTQIKVRLVRDDVTELLHHPLGNHIVVLAGHHEARLRVWWQSMIG